MHNLAYYQATHFMQNPCCICAKYAGKIVESAIHVSSEGQWSGFWVAVCAQDRCGFLGMSDQSCVWRLIDVSTSTFRAFLRLQADSREIYATRFVLNLIPTMVLIQLAALADISHRSEKAEVAALSKNLGVTFTQREWEIGE